MHPQSQLAGDSFGGSFGFLAYVAELAGVGGVADESEAVGCWVLAERARGAVLVEHVEVADERFDACSRWRR